MVMLAVIDVVAELGKQTKQTRIAFDRRTNGRTPAFDHRNWHHIPPNQFKMLCASK